MDARSQDRWNAANRKDTFFNSTLLGVAALLLMYAVLAGNVESGIPQREGVATAAIATVPTPPVIALS